MRLIALAALCISALAFSCSIATAADPTTLHKSVQTIVSGPPPLPAARPDVPADAASIMSTMAANSPALPSATTTQVVVQPAPVAAPESFGWGDYVAKILEAVRTGAVALFVWVVSRWVPAILKPIITDQLLTQAANFGFGAVEGAVKGQVMTVDIANEWVRVSAQYARDHGAPWLLKWIGDTIEPKLIARAAALGALPQASSANNLLSTE